MDTRLETTRSEYSIEGDHERVVVAVAGMMGRIARGDAASYGWRGHQRGSACPRTRSRPRGGRVQVH